MTYLKPTRGHRRQGKHPEAELIDWEGFTFEPRADDEDLLDIGDVARMTRISSTSTARAALRRTGGPQGFTLGAQQHLVFRKGEIRRWIAAVEASQKPHAVPVPSVATRKTPRDKKSAQMRALPGLEPLFDDVEAS